MGSEAIRPEVIKKRMWLDYQYACSNPANEALDSIHGLISRLADPDLDMHAFLQEAADTMCNKMYVSEVTIGLRHQDGKYRYEMMSGLSEDKWSAHKGLAYTVEDFVSQEVYKFKEISKYTRLFLVEDNPYGTGEDGTYSRELMLQSVRHSLDDTIEGDYLDVHMLGKGDEILGWIEISGMKNGRFPEVQTIKSVELLASVIGVALSYQARRQK